MIETTLAARPPALRAITTAAAALVAVALAACAPAYDRKPPPLDRLATAEAPGIPGARNWGDAPPADIAALAAEVGAQRRAAGLGRNLSALVLSGGADYGAFGAGVLNGWTERGDRPEFAVVTGVSTGALIAPFAFLGSAHDDELRLVYGGLPPDRIFRQRPLVDIFSSVSVADTAPLRKTIAGFVDDAFLADIAAQHARGRRLLVQATSLDAERPVIFDLGVIASSDAPGRRDIFIDALLASASVPGAFPPVMMPVEIDGRIYDEMLVDGGIISQDTVLEGWQSGVAGKSVGDSRVRTYYVIRNGKVAPEPKVMDYRLLPIVQRSVGSLIKSQGIANLTTGYGVARLRGADYRVTWIDDGFTLPYVGPFDQEHMRALFEYGRQRTLRGEIWSDLPPILLAKKAASQASR